MSSPVASLLDAVNALILYPVPNLFLTPAAQPRHPKRSWSPSPLLRPHASWASFVHSPSPSASALYICVVNLCHGITTWQSAPPARKSRCGLLCCLRRLAYCICWRAIALGTKVFTSGWILHVLIVKIQSFPCRVEVRKVGKFFCNILFTSF